MAGSILATMGFLPENVTPERPDYKLFEEMWEIMDGEAREGVGTEDLGYMLMVIRGFRDPEIEVDCEPVEDKQGIARMIVFDDEGKMLLRKGGQTKLANKFRSFYINKLQAEARSNYPRIAKPAEIAAEKELKRKPTISAKTAQIAEQRRLKIGSSNDDVVTHLYKKATIMLDK